MRRPYSVLGVVLTALAIATAACSGGGDEESAPAPPPPATTEVAPPAEPPPGTEAPPPVETEAPPAETEPAEPQPFPTGSNPSPVQPGRYFTTLFQPGLAFDLPATQAIQSPSDVYFTVGSGSVTIVHLDRQNGIIEPESEGLIRSVGPFPDDMIAWYAEHPRFVAGEVQEVTVGPFEGRAVDVTPKAGEAYEIPGNCPACVGAFVGPPPLINVLWEGDKEREIVIEVDGQPLFVQITAPEDVFEDTVAQAEEIFSTMSLETTDREEIEGGFGTGWLAAGIHTTEQFAPAFSLELAEDWVGAIEAPDLLNIYKDARLYLAAVNLSDMQVFDPSAETPTAIDPFPDFLSWLQMHPKLVVTDPGPAALGGQEFISFDVTVKPGAGEPGCYRACVFLFEGSLGPIVQNEGDRARIYIRDVDGTLVTSFAILIPEYAFEELVPEGEAILETLKFS